MLTEHQMRAMELILEQQERFEFYRRNRALDGIPVDVIVHEFFETLFGSEFEVIVLNKIGRLLAPNSTENLALNVFQTTERIVDNDA